MRNLIKTTSHQFQQTSAAYVATCCECGWTHETPMRHGRLGEHRAMAAAHMQTCIALNPLATDQKTVAERQWQRGMQPSKPQLPADHGLFSDDHLQLDLIEMMQTPVED